MTCSKGQLNAVNFSDYVMEGRASAYEARP